MTAKDILAASDAAATWCSLHSMRDALACYMLRSVGHLRFEEIAAELELESRKDVLLNFNSISVARSGYTRCDARGPFPLSICR